MHIRRHERASGRLQRAELSVEDLGDQFASCDALARSAEQLLLLRALPEQSQRAAGSFDGDSDPTVARATGQLAVCLDLAGRIGEAREQHERAIGLFEAIAAQGGITDLGVALGNYADTVRRQGDLDNARGLFARANDVAIADYGRDSATSLAGLAHVLQAQGKASASRRAASRARRAAEAGATTPDDVLALLLLVEVAQADGDAELAEALTKQARRYADGFPKLLFLEEAFDTLAVSP